MRQDALALREVRVRTVRPDEEPRWNELMRERHYLGFRNFCGKRLRQVAVHGERWLALIGWHAAALHCAARDRWIGWSSLQRRQRLFLVANQSRFLLLSEAGSSPHLASRVLGLSLRQLPREWQRLHGSALLLAESFVDPARFAGTCYRAANWLEVGATQGFGRVRGGAIGYRHHGAPKRVFVYPLRRDARQQLAAARAQPAWRPHQPRLMLNDAQWRSLRCFLDQVPDTRSRRGLRYPMRTALAILLGSRLAGCQTLTELSDFGRALSQQTLAAIGSRRRPQTGRYEAPCISSWHDLLKRIDAAEVERLLAAWTAAQVLGNPEDSADGEAPLRAIAMDGKVLRGSYDRDLGADGVLLDKPAQQQLSALDLDSGTVVGQLGFSGQKEDAEGAALRVLARTFADSGMCVIADALHTQRGTAQELLGLGLDFVFTVKANQPNVLAQVHEGFHWDCMSAHQSLSCEHGRIETRSIRVADELDPTVPYVDFPRGALRGATATSGRIQKGRSQAQARNRLPADQPAAGTGDAAPPAAAEPVLLGDRESHPLGARRGLARGPQSHPQGHPAASAGGLRQLRDLAATAAENAEYQTAHGATALEPEPGRRPAPRLNRLHPLPSARLVGWSARAPLRLPRAVQLPSARAAAPLPVPAR